MRPDPLDRDHAGSIGDARFQAIGISFYVEDHQAAAEEARRGMPLPYVMWRGPCRAFDVREPVVDPPPGIGVPAAEQLEAVAPKYFHPCATVWTAMLPPSAHNGNF